jgi:hypothetical protein
MSQDSGGIENRKFPRFKVAHFDKIKAKLDKHYRLETIVTLGLGGCGFYGIEGEPGIIPPRRVFSIFQMEGALDHPIEIQGNLVYAKPLKLQGKEIIFYGVEFLEIHRGLIKPIVDKLEELSQKGIIEAA